MLEDWIWENLSPIEKDSATLLYEQMESQSAFKLPGIYQPLDVKNKGHWFDIAICSAFAAALGEARVILDIGPGDGWPILRIAHLFEKAVGIDLSSKRVEVQQENAKRLGVENVEFFVMDSMVLDFPDESFHGVVAASSIEQSKDPKKTLQEIERVLIPGGRLAMYYEDLEVYFSSEKGDERIWAHLLSHEPILFYGCRESDPPREAVYALSLHKEELEKRVSFKENLLSIAAKPWATINSEDLFSASLSNLHTLVKDCHYYMLTHLSPHTLERDLRDLGFSTILPMDPFFSDVMDFFQIAKEQGYLSSFEDTFPLICEILGRLKVREREEGYRNFIVATKEK